MSALRIEWLYEIDEYGESPLSRVSKSGRMDIANILFHQNIEDALKEVTQAPEIHRASYFGYDDVVTEMTASGHDTESLDQQGERPIHKAARHGHYKVVQVLLDSGAEIDAPNALGLTPLHWAVIKGDVEMVELLLNRGANPTVRDWVTGGKTPLQIARLMKYKEITENLEYRQMLW